MKKIILLSLCTILIVNAQKMSQTPDSKPMNILTKPFETKHGTPPFNQINVEDYKPAFELAITQAKAEINQITNNKSAPTFENTIMALEYSGQQLSRIRSVFNNLNSAETTDELQKLAQEMSPIFTAYANDISLNQALFSRINQLHQKKNQLKLTPEQLMVLEKTYKSFVRNGALLDDAKKAELRQVNEKLSLLSLKFGQNVLAETNNYFLQITDEKRLDGLPDNNKEMAKKAAKDRGIEGWVFTLHFPSYGPAMKYLKDRDLRKELFLASGSKGFQSNEFNNENNIKELVALRHQRANLLGYKTHADFVLEERMAKTSEKVYGFLNDLLSKAKPAAQKEYDQLKAFASATDGLQDFQSWDASFYSEKLKQKLFNLDDEALRPYFKLDNVLNGAFDIANKLWGITFKQVNDIQVYHPDVQTYEVFDQDGKFLAVFYADFHPRKGKRQGAWMTAFRSQYQQNEVNYRPQVANVCNFTPPTDSKPSLLTFNEVTTLFHEFGHGLHGILANTTYPSVSGTSVYWDFVELPSQIMENWCYEPEALKLFAKHYQTGEVIPQEYIEKIKESAQFMQGLFTLRQLSLGLLDMAYHSKKEDIANVKAFEVEAMKPTAIYPDVPQTLMSSSFSHIFAGGYSAGYYSYKWAEVLDADAFAYFQEKGIFNKEVAKKFRDHVLSKGGTEHPMELYKKFRGQEPKPEALLKRSGLL